MKLEARILGYYKMEECGTEEWVLKEYREDIGKMQEEYSI